MMLPPAEALPFFDLEEALDLRFVANGSLRQQIRKAHRALQSTSTLPQWDSLCALQVGDDRVDLGAKLGLARDDAGDVGVERLDVGGDAGVLGIDVGADSDVVTILR